MMFQATVAYQGVSLSFKVADCGYGIEWARTRAIAHFLTREPTIYLQRPELKRLSPRQLKPLLLSEGLTADLEAADED
jgi:hypothetical protein